ncbi:hypothetical protein JOD43_004032 [Pullulanibacillus pueri]|uniref:Uncharacterized protein n=1 Tax=Pullulanibacillus pueri TaxID=1437324 RepID=A0A8J2ZZ25_9BACL|nr:hypothetical protein [Pullulanibacillus pueri]MBM7683841.1 hypothetical protein [Pullulanibacillus pueri]GGH87720.1 hypothetical protein GCM10007096_38380 [Pullulanibacillus pueri]
MVNIRFSHLHVDEVRQSSGIFSGRNVQIGWRANGQQNQGFGQVTGQNNKMHDHIHTVVKPDPMKAPD